jgi:hypothetical protein
MKPKSYLLIGLFLVLAMGIYLYFPSPAKIARSPAVQDDAPRKPSATSTIATSQPVTNNVQDPEGKPVAHTLEGATAKSYFEFRMLLNDLPDKLTPAQTHELIVLYASIVDERLDYEVKTAAVHSVSKTNNIIDIPSYADNGNAFKGRFSEGVKNILGDTVSDKSIARINLFADANNAGWGEYAQRIQVEYDTAKESFRFAHSIDPDGPSGSRRYITGELSPGFYLSYEKFLPFFPKKTITTNNISK